MADDAFDELIESVKPGLERAFGAAYGLDGGQEALGEALAWAWEHRERVQLMPNPAGYLYRVGQSKTRRRRAPTVLPEPTELGIHDVEPALVAGLRALTGRQRACIALVIADQWTYTEAADLLGISKSSVQNHVDRALASLRAHLGANDAQQH